MAVGPVARAAYHWLTCAGVMSSTGTFSKVGSSQSLSSCTYRYLVDGDSSRTRSQAAENSPNVSGGCATVEPGGVQVRFSMSTMMRASSSRARRFVLNVVRAV